MGVEPIAKTPKGPYLRCFLNFIAVFVAILIEEANKGCSMICDIPFGNVCVDPSHSLIVRPSTYLHCHFFRHAQVVRQGGKAVAQPCSPTSGKPLRLHMRLMCSIIAFGAIFTTSSPSLLADSNAARSGGIIGTVRLEDLFFVSFLRTSLPSGPYTAAPETCITPWPKSTSLQRSAINSDRRKLDSANKAGISTLVPRTAATNTGICSGSRNGLSFATTCGSRTVMR